MSENQTAERGRKPIMKRRPSGKFVMHDFQREDIAYMSELEASANWSEMGAMKTTTAEWLWATKLKHVPNPRILVITTKSGKGTYYESLSEVLPEWDVYTVDANHTRMVIGSRVVPTPLAIPNPLYMRPVVVIAHYHCFTDRACIPQQVKGENGLPVFDQETGIYEMTDPKCMWLLRAHWDAVICDEAHRLKNHEAQWTKNIKKIKAQFRHIMTGTGFVNNPAEIWSLLNFLFPQHYTSYWKFRSYFCLEEIGYQGYKKIVGIRPEREEEFRELVRKVGVRRTMLECFPNIKEPIETVIPVDLSPTQKRMYEEIMRDLHTLDAKGEPMHSPNVISMMNRLRQICVATPEKVGEHYDAVLERVVPEIRLKEPSSKLDAAMETIEGLEWDSDNKQQIVVFSNFKDPLELLQIRLDKKKIPYIRLEQSMNEQTRYQLWAEIWPKKEHQVFLTTLQLGSESINLTSANRALFLDQSWSPATNKQAIGRVYRPGQTAVAQLIYVRADGTMDYYVKDKVDTKLGWFQQIFGHVYVDNDDDDTENGDDDDD